MTGEEAERRGQERRGRERAGVEGEGNPEGAGEEGEGRERIGSTGGNGVCIRGPSGDRCAGPPQSSPTQLPPAPPQMYTGVNVKP